MSDPTEKIFNDDWHCRINNYDKDEMVERRPKNDAIEMPNEYSFQPETIVTEVNLYCESSVGFVGPVNVSTCKEGSTSMPAEKTYVSNVTSRIPKEESLVGFTKVDQPIQMDNVKSAEEITLRNEVSYKIRRIFMQCKVKIGNRHTPDNNKSPAVLLHRNLKIFVYEFFGGIDASVEILSLDPLFALKKLNSALSCWDYCFLKTNPMCPVSNYGTYLVFCHFCQVFPELVIIVMGDFLMPYIMDSKIPPDRLENYNRELHFGLCFMRHTFRSYKKIPKEILDGVTTEFVGRLLDIWNAENYVSGELDLISDMLRIINFHQKEKVIQAFKERSCSIAVERYFQELRNSKLSEWCNVRDELIYLKIKLYLDLLENESTSSLLKEDKLRSVTIHFLRNVPPDLTEKMTRSTTALQRLFFVGLHTDKLFDTDARMLMNRIVAQFQTPEVLVEDIIPLLKSFAPVRAVQ